MNSAENNFGKVTGLPVDLDQMVVPNESQVQEPRRTKLVQRVMALLVGLGLTFLPDGEAYAQSGYNYRKEMTAGQPTQMVGNRDTARRPFPSSGDGQPEKPRQDRRDIVRKAMEAEHSHRSNAMRPLKTVGSEQMSSRREFMRGATDPVKSLRPTQE